METVKTKRQSPVVPIIAALVAMLCVGVIYLWSVLKSATEAYYGWDPGSVRLIASIMLFAFCVGNFGGGALNDRFGPKKISFLGVIIFGVGVFLASLLKQGSSIWLFYLTYSVVGGIGVGVAYGALLSCVQKWFPHKRGFATGIATAAFGLGTVAFSPIIGSMLKSMTVSATLRILSIVFLVVGLIACCFIKLPSEEYLAALPKPAAKKNAIVSTREVPLGEAIRTIPFWCILLTIFFYNATWNMLNPIIKPLGEERGLSTALATTCVALTGAFNAAGRFSMSALSDKLGRVETNVLLCCITIVCALLLMFVGNGVYLVVVLITAFAFGGPSAINPATTTDFFGAKYTGTNYGVAMLTLGLSSILFNALSNALVNSTGTYYTTFVMGAVTAAITIALQLIMKKYKKKMSAEAPEPAEAPEAEKE
ncbi:MAG: OFA family MFS transporter [Oscillospiraceae bacterium]|nr:OFA family MFS transporter [Oscillospiraceae bacterium]